MRVAPLLRTIAVLLLIVSAFMLFPVAFGLYYGELELAGFFLVPMAGVAFIGLAVLLATRRVAVTLSHREGFVLVTFAWIASALVGCLPLYLCGAIPSFTDAFFETMSGFTTTGASILTEIESLPKSMLFWRSLTHWLGGMGIVVLTIAILPLLGIGAYQMMKAEAPGPSLDKITPKITETARILWMIYLGFTAAQTALLLVGGMSLFDALTHTFGTLATGGFSPRNRSVGHFDSGFIHVVVTVFMLMAGMNFVLHYGLITGRLKKVFANVELRAYLGIFAASTAVVAFSLHGRVYGSFPLSFRHAAFQTASILTTTGFTTGDYAAWPFLAQAVLFVLTFIGGCSGSTGGGIKVIRIVALFKLGFHEMKYMAHPRGVFSLRLGREPLKKDIIYSISGFVLLYLFMLLLTTLVVATGGYDLITSLSSALVTLGNIGPGFGRIGPTLNYAFLPGYIKWFLSFAMLVGRLEVYTVLVLLTPRFWRA